MTIDKLKQDREELIQLHSQVNAEAARLAMLTTKYAGAVEVLDKMIAREEELAKANPAASSDVEPQA